MKPKTGRKTKSFGKGLLPSPSCPAYQRVPCKISRRIQIHGIHRNEHIGIDPGRIERGFRSGTDGVAVTASARTYAAGEGHGGYPGNLSGMGQTPCNPRRNRIHEGQLAGVKISHGIPFGSALRGRPKQSTPSSGRKSSRRGGFCFLAAVKQAFSCESWAVPSWIRRGSISDTFLPGSAR